MGQRTNFKGSYVAIVTPFRDGKFDEKAFHDLIEFQITHGTDGIVPCGTTGESATMTHAEHAEVVKSCIKAVRGRVPVIAGTGSNSTREAIGLTRDAKDAGADAALLITPYYNKPPQQGLYEHYKAIAEAVDIPLIVYNCPGRTGVSITPQTLARLAKISNIVGVKDATANPDWTTEVKKGTDLTILSGDDTLTLPFMSVGAVGVISVTANILPRQVATMCKLALENKWAEARKVHEELYDITKLLFCESNPVPVKAALEMMGKIGPEIRLPLCRMGDANRELLRTELKRLGLV
ncbi:4-hydroxy-tetrahydrodipicolinate synthase [Candidatus Sumerlaeota bacterium]|nr:4-hydroxy-tetrahydrodipicolinate synthase [Candidatus Sumerlaeota bacterium]